MMFFFSLLTDSEVTKSLAIQHARKALAMEAHRVSGH